MSLESGTNLLNVGDDEGPEVILQKQYRPPVGRVTVEIPAGLIDAGETAEQCAERELKEETGYVGTAKACSPIMFNGTPTTLSARKRAITADRARGRPGLLQH